ncbi:hypothetical protein GO755_27695 [Spirosoma sp. HMF4905]|uniref:DUF4595 domain-containing protein n=1 Tax=Spirosoma arboris TaxID=2682092 RepID=A0A7K1SJ58_9BACT|nr:hypothetical protein [Spirosoma arboris]MVM33851.1 hypothetical protein [Spirosoma arboris]
MKTIYFLVILALLTTACKHDVDLLKAPDPISSLPGSGTATQPNSSTTTQPGSGTTTDGSVGVFRTFRIAYAANDYQEVQYDAANQVIYYRNQATTVLGGNGMMQQREYQFLYQPNGQLKRVDLRGAGYFLYQYSPTNQVNRVEEYSAKGRLLFIRTYQYSAIGQLVQLDAQSMTDSYVGRKTYQYDQSGNLTTCTDWVKIPGTDDYRIETVTTYADFDRGKHVENLFAAFPFLPNVTFYANNYRTRIVRYRDGNEIGRETYVYMYDAEGKPKQRTTYYSGGSLSATYSY